MSLLCETLIVNHQLMASIFINLSIKHKNNNELSLSLINKALQLEPSNSQAIVQKSQLLLNQGNVYDAFEIFQEVFVSEPDNFQLIQQFSILCLIIPFFCDKGIEIVEHGLTVYLNDFVLTRQLAKLCARRLYFKKSSNYYQSLEELNAKRLGLSGRLGYALVEQKLGSHQNAKRLINEAIKLSDDNTKQFLVQNDQVQAVRSQAMKGHLQIVSNDFETARSTFSQLSNKQASINYDIDRYRHDTEIKINQLADITAHRDIAILAHGPSLYQFEEKLDQFKLIDLCYWGMERFRITETNIVQPLNTHHHVIMVTVAQFMNNMASMLIDYLQQSEKNVLITSIEAMNALKKPNLCRAEMENKFGDQIIYFTNDIGSPASPVDPCNLLGGNVLSMMIPFACLAKPKRIFIFGGDGFLPNGYQSEQTHFKSTTEDFTYKLPEKSKNQTNIALAGDTVQFNDIWQTNVEAFCVLHNVPRPLIYNVNPESQLNIHPKISYDECIKFLKK